MFTVAVSPPRTKPLVAIAEVDRPVMVVTKVAIRIITMVSPVTHKQIEPTKTNSEIAKDFNKTTLINHIISRAITVANHVKQFGPYMFQVAISVFSILARKLAQLL